MPRGKMDGGGICAIYARNGRNGKCGTWNFQVPTAIRNSSCRRLRGRERAPPMGEDLPNPIILQHQSDYTAVIQRGEQIVDLEENLASSLMSGDGRSTNMDTGAQIFSSLPSFIDAASFLTSCFTGSLEEYFIRETNMRQLEMISISGDQGSESFSDSLMSTSDVANSRQNQEAESSTSLFQSLITRARKTVHGSADDIGWLERAEGMPPVEDGTQRFTELLDKIKKNEHKLPDSVVYLLVPGLFSNHGRMYFVNIKKIFSKMGLACHIAKIHSEASVEKNAREIKEYIEEIYWGAKKKVLLFGHSKGGVDSAAALALYWADLKDKVAGLVLAQSPFAGSPIASDILRPGQLGDYVNLRKITEFLFCKILKGDLQALEDLTYERRREFLSQNQLPPELPVVSFHTTAGIGAAGAMASLSHVAHAELPAVATVPVVVPLAAALAACAQLLQVRYGEKSDGLVTRRDAEVPGSVVVRPERMLDHGWMVYSSIGDGDEEGDAAHVCEALLTLLVEVARQRRRDDSAKEE